MGEEATKDSRVDTILTVTYLVGIVGFLLAFCIPYYALLAGGGAEEQVNLTKFMFYLGVIALSLLVLFSFKVARHFAKNKETREIIDVPVHDPEKGLFYKVKDVPVLKFFFRTTKSVWLLFLFSLIIFIPFVAVGGFLNQSVVEEQSFLTKVYPQTAFAGSSTFVEQQVTETAEWSLSVWPASPSETLQMIVLGALLWVGVKYAVLKKKWLPRVMLPFLLFGVIIITGLSHFLLHLFRYGSSELDLIAVLLFGMISSALYWTTRSVVMPLVYHDVNNGVLKLFNMGVLGSDASIAVLVVIMVALVTLFVFSYRGKYSRKKEVVLS